MYMSEKLKVKKIEIGGIKYFIDNKNILYDIQSKEEIGIFNRETNTIEETYDIDFTLNIGGKNIDFYEPEEDTIEDLPENALISINDYNSIKYVVNNSREPLGIAGYDEDNKEWYFISIKDEPSRILQEVGRTGYNMLVDYGFAIPIEPPTKPIDELTSKKNEYKSFFKIFKEKKAEYDANKTKELKKELLQMKAKADKFLLEIEALREAKSGLKNGAGMIDNTELYEKAKEIVYKQYPKHSAYRSGQLVKKYKEMGGTYSGKKNTDGLTRWYKEEWKDIGSTFGKSRAKDEKMYPVYRPTKRITKDTPLTPEEIKPSNLRAQIVLKQEIKGNENLPPFLPLGKVLRSLRLEPKKAELSNKNGAGVYSLGQSADNISQYDEIYKYSNPKKVQELAKKYFQGDEALAGKGGIIYRSIKKDKKYMVYNPNTEKWVHFGQMKYEDFTKHKDEKRRKNYLTRSANIKGDWKNDKYSPNNLSRNLLW